MDRRERFYAVVKVRAADQGFEITLDDRPVRTPLGRPLVLPTEALTQAVADEWAAQGSEIVPASMPLTGIANTAIDRARNDRDSFRAAVAAYGRSDLLCQRAEAPADLARRQEATWEPWLAWAAERYGARLAVGVGVMPVRQPPEAMLALDNAVAELDEWNLAAAGLAVAAGGSLVLALALIEGCLESGEAFALAVLEEAWQNERWGEDREALARRDAIAADLAAAGRFARLARAD